MANVLIAAIVFYCVLVAGMYLGQRQLMYLPSQAQVLPAESGVPEMTVVRLETRDGLVLRAWFRPAPPGRPTLVYFHGNGGHLGHRAFKVKPFLVAGLGVLLVGYRGYGGNPGSPDEDGLYADADAAMDFLAEQGVRSNSVVLYGESLGTGVAVEKAVRQARAGSPVAALVLEAPFASMPLVAQDHYPFAPARWLVKDRYDSLAKIADVATPLLIVHGELDHVVDQSHGRRLAAAARKPVETLWIPGAGHENLFTLGAQNGVLDFIDRQAVSP